MAETSSHSRPRWRPIILLVTIAALASAPFLYGKFKQHRARQLAQKSIELAAAGNPRGAREAAEAAFHLAPESPDSLRARARSAASATDRFFFSTALLNSDRATPADARLHLETCIELNFAAGIDAQLARLLEAEPSVVENWLIAGRINLLRNRPRATLGCARRALELAPQSRSARLLTARAALKSPEKQFRDAANSTLRGLVAQEPTDETSLEALISLLPESYTEVVSHPLANAEHLLLASHQRISAATTADVRETIIAEDHRQAPGARPRVARPLVERPAACNRVTPAGRLRNRSPIS